MTTDLRAQVVEAMAQAFYEADDGGYRDSWESQPEPGVKDWYRRMAEAALDAALGVLGEFFDVKKTWEVETDRLLDELRAGKGSEE